MATMDIDFSILNKTHTYTHKDTTTTGDPWYWPEKFIPSTPTYIQEPQWTTFPYSMHVCTNSCNQHPHRCPNCAGKGIVPEGFYKLSEVNYYPTMSAGKSDDSSEPCRSCEKGIIWR